MQTEPEQWAVVQEVETVTGDFLTEPGARFYRIVIDGYCADFDHRQAAENFVAAIQRAFEERERKLREAGEVLRREAALLHQNAIGCARNHYGCDFELHGMPQWLVDTGARIFTATQALKETPDAG